MKRAVTLRPSRLGSSLKSALTLLALLLALPCFAGAESSKEDGKAATVPTFYGDVLPILQQNCQTCHRPAGENIGGMLAPMTLMSYDEVRPWARAIAQQTQARAMPPWFATQHTTGLFAGERRLSDMQIETLERWARSGAPAGDASVAPPPVRFAQEGAQGWTNGLPDLVVSLPQPFWVKDDVRDLNINFPHTLTELQLAEDTWIRGVEFKVGGTFVHHMCASYVPPGVTASRDSGKFSRYSLGCIALGAEPTLLPEGYGYLLPKGSTIQFSMHYHKEPGEGTGRWDQSQMGLIFNKEPVTHRVRYEPIGNLFFEIPPKAERWRVGAAQTLAEDSTLVALWPHAHLRAVGARYEAVYPDGRRELLLDVPHYDQEWQTTYRYLEPKEVPAGTRLEVSMWFDNTEERAGERGFDSARATRFGLATTDEMMLGFLAYTHTEPIDFAAEPEKIDDAGLVMRQHTFTGGGN